MMIYGILLNLSGGISAFFIVSGIVGSCILGLAQKIGWLNWYNNIPKKTKETIWAVILLIILIVMVNSVDAVPTDTQFP